MDGSLKSALEAKIKETALKIYLLESQAQHESFSLQVLQDSFELDR